MHYSERFASLKFAEFLLLLSSICTIDNHEESHEYFTFFSIDLSLIDFAVKKETSYMPIRRSLSLFNEKPKLDYQERE